MRITPARIAWAKANSFEWCFIHNADEMLRWVKDAIADLEEVREHAPDAEDDDGQSV